MRRLARCDPGVDVSLIEAHAAAETHAQDRAGAGGLEHPTLRHAEPVGDRGGIDEAAAHDARSPACERDCRTGYHSRRWTRRKEAADCPTSRSESMRRVRAASLPA